jgi:tetratricopeptide (TPR) repeat protein
MTFFFDLLGMLTFRTHALRAQAERCALVGGVVCFSLGFGAYAMVRNSVYAELPELLSQQSGLIESFLDLNLIQAILFLMLVYVPALIILGNALSGDGIGSSFSKREYQGCISVLLPLWGMLSLIAAPIQWLIPHFLLFGGNGITVGILIRLLLVLIYTLWAIQHLSYLSLMRSIGVFVLSCFTLPVYFLITEYLSTEYLSALPFFFMIPLIYMGTQWIRAHFSARTGEQAFQQHLHTLTINPQDADAHYQLGIIHLKRRNLEAARKCFIKAIEIDPRDPDYHYSLGRSFELKGEWAPALEQYEETYRINPEYRLGEVFREVGKGYVNLGNIEKGIEFLTFFLTKRNSDPEGRYWLAVALQKSGDLEQMQIQLHMILLQTRSNPRFFRKENREWIYRARMMIRDARFEMKN